MENEYESARELIRNAYRASGGRPTDDLRRVYQAFLDNDRRREQELISVLVRLRKSIVSSL